jgi:very-short-patch-repair endonuclease
MDVHLLELAAVQADVVAARQLIARGWTRRQIERRAAAGAWTTVHRGVFALTQAPLTQRQAWFAATLTEPGTVLSHVSAALCWGFSTRPCPVPMVTRPGSGGPRRFDGVLVFRSRLLVGETKRREGIPLTTVERTLIDLSSRESRARTSRNVREALRLRLTSARRLAAALDRHRGRRGTRILWDLAERYSGLPYARTRSNAEARALEVLQDAGLMPQAVNRRIAGEEADLVWFDRRLIVEVDGPQYHRFTDEDERKRQRWEVAGYEVRRIQSGDVYANPDALVALARN